MEAERLGQTEPANECDKLLEAVRARAENATWEAIREAQDEAIAGCIIPARDLDPKAGRVSCLRCGGDAGFLGLSCQRVGGCKTKAERVAALVPAVLTWKEWAHDHDKPEHPNCGSCIVVEAEQGYETRYGVCIDRGIRPGRFATLDGAIATWRTAMTERMGE